MPSAALVRAQIEASLGNRVPGVFTSRTSNDTVTMLTGVDAIDAAMGGIPVGGITEIVAPSLCSNGLKTLQAQFLAVAAREQSCALIDGSDTFDPRSAEAAGVNLKRVLWVRGGGHDVKALEHAFKLADMLLQGCGGFALILVDLAGIAERAIRKVPLNTWFRFGRVMEKLDTALVFATPCPVVGTCSSLTLNLSAGQVHWSRPMPNSPAHARLVAALDFRVEIAARRSFKKNPQSASGFSAWRRWA